MGSRFLWKQDSRRDAGEGQGASVTWACACPGLCCWLGLLALVRWDGEGGSMDALLSAVPWGALWTQCLGARQKVSGHQSASYDASQTYRQLPSTHMPTTLCTDLHRGRRRPSIWQSSFHTGTEQSTSGILLPHCQPVLRCDLVRTTGHNLPTNMLLPRGRTSAQVPLSCTWRWEQLELPRKGSSGGKPGVASSSLTGITLGALLVKDQRHPGWALNKLKHLKNLSLQGFLKQKPWPVDTQIQTILLDEDSPAKWAPIGCGTGARGWVPGYRVQISVRVCHRESDFTTLGTLHWIDTWHLCT